MLQTSKPAPAATLDGRFTAVAMPRIRWFGSYLRTAAQARIEVFRERGDDDSYGASGVALRENSLSFAFVTCRPGQEHIDHSGSRSPHGGSFADEVRSQADRPSACIARGGFVMPRRTLGKTSGHAEERRRRVCASGSSRCWPALTAVFMPQASSRRRCFADAHLFRSQRRRGPRAGRAANAATAPLTLVERNRCPCDRRTTHAVESARRGRTLSPSPACFCSRRARNSRNRRRCRTPSPRRPAPAAAARGSYLPRIVHVRPLPNSSRTGFPSRKSEPSSCFDSRTARSSIMGG